MLAYASHMSARFIDSCLADQDEKGSNTPTAGLEPASSTSSTCDDDLIRFLPLIAQKLTWQETVALETKIYDCVDPHALFLKIKQQLGVSIDVRRAGLKTIVNAMMRNEQNN